MPTFFSRVLSFLCSTGHILSSLKNIRNLCAVAASDFDFVNKQRSTVVGSEGGFLN